MGILVNGPVSVTLYASSDATLDSSDTPLATFSRRVRLNVGQGRRLSIGFATPSSLPDGSDYLLANVEGGAAVAGNVFASPNPVTVKQPYVDLVTEFVYLPVNSIQTNGIVSNHPWAADERPESTGGG